MHSRLIQKRTCTAKHSHTRTQNAAAAVNDLQCVAVGVGVDVVAVFVLVAWVGVAVAVAPHLSCRPAQAQYPDQLLELHGAVYWCVLHQRRQACPAAGNQMCQQTAKSPHDRRLSHANPPHTHTHTHTAPSALGKRQHQRARI